MPVVQANGIDINYETEGAGEPIVLVPYLAADQACYAFQVAEYAKHFTCVSVESRAWPSSCAGARCRRWTRSCASPRPC